MVSADETEDISVSIITVSFNSEKTIERTVKSVISQTYKNLEYIIVDGGSGDKTVDIIKGYSEKYDFISYTSEPDNGIYDAMNKGIERAGGEIIGIINSDDWYEENAVAIIVKSFLENGRKQGVYYGEMGLFKDGKEKPAYFTIIIFFPKP